jgi:hypothetical protein
VVVALTVLVVEHHLLQLPDLPIWSLNTM